MTNADLQNQLALLARQNERILARQEQILTLLSRQAVAKSPADGGAAITDLSMDAAMSLAASDPDAYCAAVRRETKLARQKARERRGNKHAH